MTFLPLPNITMPEYIDMLSELQRRMREVEGLLIEGLTTDGAQHKQWCLWMIADILKIDFSGIDLDNLDKGIAP